MKKIFTAIVLAIASSFLLTGCGYNGLVAQREAVEQQWANVENQYQKRADLVPNLVATVKGFAKHEEKVFTEIAESRAKLGGNVTVDSSITDDPEKFAQFQKTQKELGAGLGRLLALTENYPELKSNTNFLDLQSQLEGIENAKDTTMLSEPTTRRSRCFPGRSRQRCFILKRRSISRQTREQRKPLPYLLTRI